MNPGEINLIEFIQRGYTAQLNAITAARAAEEQSKAASGNGLPSAAKESITNCIIPQKKAVVKGEA